MSVEFRPLTWDGDGWTTGRPRSRPSSAPSTASGWPRPRWWVTGSRCTGSGSATGSPSSRSACASLHRTAPGDRQRPVGPPRCWAELPNGQVRSSDQVTSRPHGVLRRSGLADQQPSEVGPEQVVGVRAGEPDRLDLAGRSPPRRAQPGRTSTWPWSGSIEHRRRAGEPGGPQVDRPVVDLLRRTDLDQPSLRPAAPPGRPGRAPPRRRGWRTPRLRRCPAGGRPAPRGTRRGRGCPDARSARRTGRATAAGPAPGPARPAAAPRRTARRVAGRPGGRCAAGLRIRRASARASAGLPAAPDG